VLLHCVPRYVTSAVVTSPDGSSPQSILTCFTTSFVCNRLVDERLRNRTPVSGGRPTT